jgi:alpha-tubulin suppressor-like RCC1 family protein
VWAGGPIRTDPSGSPIIPSGPPDIWLTNSNHLPFIHQVAGRAEDYLKALAAAKDSLGTALEVVVCDDGGFNPDVDGEYTVKLCATDSAGGFNEINTTVTVWKFNKVAPGRYGSMAMDTLGRAWSWGMGHEYPMADGSTSNQTKPRLVDSVNELGKVVDVDASETSRYAVLDDGRVFGWGTQSFGQLGVGNTSTQRRPAQMKIPDGEKIVQICASYYTAFARAESGKIFAVGYGTAGQTGQGSSSTVNTPVQVKLPSDDATAVASGWNNGGALMSNGDVYVWGRNTYGELGRPTSDCNTNCLPMKVPNLPPALDVKGGEDHFAALTTTGEVWSWGYNGVGQLGIGSTGGSVRQATRTPMVDGATLKASYQGTFSIASNGDLWGAGYGGLSSGYLFGTAGNTMVKSTWLDDVWKFSSYYMSSLALQSDGAVIYGGGDNGGWQLGTGNTTAANSAPSQAVIDLPPAP